MANVISYKGQKYVRVDRMSDEHQRNIEKIKRELLSNLKKLNEVIKNFEHNLYDKDFEDAKARMLNATSNILKAYVLLK